MKIFQGKIKHEIIQGFEQEQRNQLLINEKSEIHILKLTSRQIHADFFLPAGGKYFFAYPYLIRISKKFFGTNMIFRIKS